MRLSGFNWIFLRKGGKRMVNNVTTKLDQLNLVYKFLFDEIMEDIDSYRAVVSILLENEIL